MNRTTDSKPASVELAIHRVVAIDLSGGNVGQVRYPTAATERCYGSTSQSISTAQIAAGRLNASIDLPGDARLIDFAVSGGAVVAGDMLMVTGAVGKLGKHDTTATKRVAGYALEALAADGQIYVQLLGAQVEYSAMNGA